jgi:hypothetical protein
MQPTLIFLVMASVIGAAQSQTWTGTYTADSSCSTSVCCCLSGSVVLTSSSTNTYTVNSPVSGVCSISTFTGTAYTSGYTGWLIVSMSNDTLTLSSDSKTITVTNTMSPACSGKGVKSGAIKQHANIIMLFAIALVGVATSTSKI